MRNYETMWKTLKKDLEEQVMRVALHPLTLADIPSKRKDVLDRTRGKMLGMEIVLKRMENMEKEHGISR